MIKSSDSLIRQKLLITQQGANRSEVKFEKQNITADYENYFIGLQNENENETFDTNTFSSDNSKNKQTKHYREKLNGAVLIYDTSLFSEYQILPEKPKLEITLDLSLKTEKPKKVQVFTDSKNMSIGSIFNKDQITDPNNGEFDKQNIKKLTRNNDNIDGILGNINSDEDKYINTSNTKEIQNHGFIEGRYKKQESKLPLFNAKLVDIVNELMKNQIENKISTTNKSIKNLPPSKQSDNIRQTSEILTSKEEIELTFNDEVLGKIKINGFKQGSLLKIKIDIQNHNDIKELQGIINDIQKVFSKMGIKIAQVNYGREHVSNVLNNTTRKRYSETAEIQKKRRTRKSDNDEEEINELG